MPIRAVIIEDETVFRQMLSMALGKVRGLKVEGGFGDGKVGLDFCLKSKPNLLVVDLQLPGMHGLEVVKEVRAKLPETRILVLTGHPDGDLPGKLISQGVHGFVDKAEPLSYVLQAVEVVMSGGMFFASNVPAKAGTVAPVPTKNATAGGPAALVLSAREIEVAKMVAEGNSSKEVASKLNLSVRTVEKHRANIMEKIGVREVASLVRYCVQAGIIQI